MQLWSASCLEHVKVVDEAGKLHRARRNDEMMVLVLGAAAAGMPEPELGVAECVPYMVLVRPTPDTAGTIMDPALIVQMMDHDSVPWESKRVALKLDMDLTVEEVLQSLEKQCNDASVAQHRLLLVVWSGHGETGTGDWVCSDGAVTYVSVRAEIFPPSS